MKRGRERGAAVEGEKTRKKKEEVSSSSAASEGKNTVLNDDVLSEILLRLPASSVLRLRRVCKSWRSLTKGPSFVRRHTRRHCDDPGAAARPKPMLFQWDPHIASPSLNLCIVDANVHNNRFLHRNVRILVKPEFTLTGPDGEPSSSLALRLSCDGLLCFLSLGGPNLYYICNPVTKTWAAVAESLNPPSRTELKGFYLHRPTGEYRLLQYFWKYRTKAALAKPLRAGYEVATVNRRRGEDKQPWRTVYQVSYPNESARNSAQKLDQLLAADIPWELSPLVLHGNLHWLPYFHDQVEGHRHFGRSFYIGIIVFDTSSEEFGSVPLPVTKNVREYSSLTPTLFELGDNLCIGIPIYPTRIGGEMELWLLKDYKNQKWIKMHSIISMEGITRSPTNKEEEEGWESEEGSLLKQWGYGYCFSLYNLRHKTCCHMNQNHASFPGYSALSFPIYSVAYTESLVTV